MFLGSAFPVLCNYGNVAAVDDVVRQPQWEILTQFAVSMKSGNAVGLELTAFQVLCQIIFLAVKQQLDDEDVKISNWVMANDKLQIFRECDYGKEDYGYIQ